MKFCIAAVCCDSGPKQYDIGEQLAELLEELGRALHSSHCILRSWVAVGIRLSNRALIQVFLGGNNADVFISNGQKYCWIK